MPSYVRTLLATILLFVVAPAARAQMPFYTDDTGVTDPHIVHVEIFNEYDGLQSSQFPNLNQNTINFKVNYGLPHHLELDLDAPYISIERTRGEANSQGFGDLDLGVKWRLLDQRPGSHRPALAATMYIEAPTGDPHNQLGSGVPDYWLNFITQTPLSEKTRITTNTGFLFAGNTETGAIGVSTTHGHVYTYGLSLTHDFTPKTTLGAEAYGGIADTDGLGRDQLQFLAGGSHTLRDGLAFTFAILGGEYEASPHIGGQLGFALDIPTAFHHSH